ncbi:hypothetical protein Tco_0158326 [Tanacetum coccineum]
MLLSITMRFYESGLLFGCYSFRTFKTGDVKFVSRVLPHKLGLKVTNLDLLGVIKDEELFGKLVDDDAIRVCLLLALEVIFMGKKLVDEVPDTLMRLVENLKVFRWGEYIWRHLYDQILNLVNKNKWEHLHGLSKFKNYVPTYTFSGFVWSFKVLGRERKGVLLTAFIDNRPAKNGLDYDDDLVKDYLIQEDCRVIQEEEERCRLEDLKMKEALFLSSLKEEVRVREEIFLLKFEEDKKKRRHDLMNSDHWKVSNSKFTNGKRSQWSGAFSAYYWGDTFVNVEKDRPLNALNDQDMTQFLKDDLSRYNKAPDRVHLTDAFDIFLGRQGPLRARFPWCKDVSVDRRFWETLVCLDPRKKGWIIDETIVIPETVIAWLVAPFFISQLGNNLVVSANYLVGEGRILCGWLLGVDGYSVTSYRMVFSVNTPYYSKLVGFNNDEEPIIEVDDTGFQMDTTLQVYNPTQGEFQNLGVDADPGSFFVGPVKDSLILVNHSDRFINLALPSLG